MSDAASSRILVVMVDPQQAAKIEAELTAAGWRVTTKGDSLDGLIAVEDERPALIVLDWSMPFIDGTIFLHALRAGLSEPPPVVALVAAGTDPAAVRAAGARVTMPLPPDTAALAAIVRSVLDGM